MSGRGSRTPSGPWGRLKPVTLDPLESYGLPSKGDNRLLDFKTQERYYTKIVDRYMSFCSKAGCGDELLRRFSSLSVSIDSSNSNPIIDKPVPPANAPRPAATQTAEEIPTESHPMGHQDLTILILAMRKLREGLVASHRIDALSTQIYIFIIRLSILLKQWESYHPALLHLLYVMHPFLPLSSVELSEFASYLILDLACRQGDLAGAYLVRNHYRVRDGKLDQVLRALAHDDYVLWWRVMRSVDGHKAKLMEFALEGMRTHALKCLGRTYLTADVEFVERVAGAGWEELVRIHGVGWERQGIKVVIRKPKGG